MAYTSHCNAVFESFPAVWNLPVTGKTRTPTTTATVLPGKKPEKEHGEQPLKSSRRSLALGFASISLFANSSIADSLAEDNGYWLTGPIPIPKVSNQIDNEETGTRSFLKTGIYIADIGTKGRIFRLKKYAFDLLALGDLIGQDALSHVRRYLRLKSTFMYYDFDKVISAASADDKPPLLDLANRLFNSFEKLEVAVRSHDLPQTKSLYQDTTVILQEVMTRMA